MGGPQRSSQKEVCDEQPVFDGIHEECDSAAVCSSCLIPIPGDGPGDKSEEESRGWKHVEMTTSHQTRISQVKDALGSVLREKNGGPVQVSKSYFASEVICNLKNSPF